MVALSADRPSIGNVSKLRVVALGLAGIVFGLLLGALVVVAIAIQFFDYQIVRVESGSMAPTLEVGDLVVVKPAGGANVEDGDIILFETNVGVPVMHRIIATNRIVTNISNQEGEQVGSITKFNFVTQGDANPQPDAQQVPGEMVRGEVWFTIPALGGTDTFSLQFFFLALAGIIVLAWVSYEAYKFLGRKSKNNQLATSQDSEEQ